MNVFFFHSSAVKLTKNDHDKIVVFGMSPCSYCVDIGLGIKVPPQSHVYMAKLLCTIKHFAQLQNS